MDNVEEVEEDAVEELSLSDSLAAAWDEAPDEEVFDDVPRGTMEEEDVGTSREAADSGSDKPDTDNQEAVHAKAKPDNVEVADSAGTELAPKSLSPAAREAWNKAPDELKKDIIRREKAYESGLQKHFGSARRAEAMDKSLAPYQQYMQMNGGPQKSIQSLLQTGAGLQMGSPIQKAQLVANLIQQFGVDISTLDNMLVGNAPPQEVQQNNEIDQRIQQAVAPYQNMMNQFQQGQQQQQQAAQYRVQNEVELFKNNPENEFYNDVALEAADILDLAASNGRDMTIGQAYEKACMLNPEISKVIQARQLAQSMGKKRQAATSIHGTPSGGGDGGSHTDLRSAIADAWDTAGRA